MMMTKQTTRTVQEIEAMVETLATATADAYSYDNYNDIGWRQAIRKLAQRGYSAREIEAIVRSKWTRWAADMSGKRYGCNTGVDLIRFMDDPRNRCTPQEVAKLVRQTFDGDDSELPQRARKMWA
jgi:hypothetical protein